ncbi:MAG: DUF1727 domain-containing protein [Bacilli bacterium]|nr:DUF1727 domain-containing protein [Bacilli bacterium]
MKTTLLIIYNRLITLICKIFKRNGSVFPGSLVNKHDKNILRKIKYPKYVIGITGSSGKGSTTSLVAYVLEKSGYKVVWNKSGSNLINAATTLILNNTNPITKKVNADILLMELDESYISQIFDKNTITHLLITNITRDQPARNGHPEIILNKIINSIGDNTHVIINVDDPFLNRIKYTHHGLVTTYGVNKTKYDSVEPINNSIDASYCPICGKKLKYNYYHTGHIGKYKCLNCDFDRNKANFEAKDVDLKKQFITINDSIYHINKDVFFAVYYTLAAYSLLKTIGINDNILKKYLNEEPLQSKRMKEYYIDNRKVNMIESKNENNLSYYESLHYIREQHTKKTVILGFDNVSRRYNLNDLSWLYDVNFEMLNDKYIDKIFIIGRFRYDVLTRLNYANIDKDKLVLIDNIDTLIERVKKESVGNIYTMVCFDMTEIIKKMILEDNNG